MSRPSHPFCSSRDASRLSAAAWPRQTILRFQGNPKPTETAEIKSLFASFSAEKEDSFCL
jgi:hypothetical protein